MTQKVFDTDSKEDMALLWSILPDEVVELTPATKIWITQDSLYFNISAFSIKWHKKIKVTRPIEEATEADIGKLCYFWDDEFKGYGILTHKDIAGDKPYYLADGNTTYDHCRRLTKQEIEELC